MIPFALPALSPRLWLYGGVAVAFLLLSTALAASWWRGNAWAARAAAAEGRAAELAIDLDEARKERQRVVAELERQQAEAAQRARDYGDLRRQIDAQPRTRACVDSPAVRRALGLLRERAGAAGAPAAAGVAPGPVQPPGGAR